MKYIKLFEQEYDEPQKGDYVNINYNKFGVKLKKFFEDEIGQISYINLKEPNFPYHVTFEKKIPVSTYGPTDDTMAFNLKEILAWSTDKDDLQIKIDTNKYNL